MPWLILVQVKGAMAHPVYQVVASVRLKVPWASHGEQFTKYSVTPPLLLHQWGLTLAPPPGVSGCENTWRHSTRIRAPGVERMWDPETGTSRPLENPMAVEVVLKPLQGLVFTHD